MRILSAVAILMLSSSAAFAADMQVPAVQQPLQVSSNQLSPVMYAPQDYYAQPAYAAPQPAARPAMPTAEAQAERKVDIMWMNSF